MFSYQAIDLWRDIPYYLRDLSTFSFAKEIKHCLLSELPVTPLRVLLTTGVFIG